MRSSKNRTAERLEATKSVNVLKAEIDRMELYMEEQTKLIQQQGDQLEQVQNTTPTFSRDYITTPSESPKGYVANEQDGIRANTPNEVLKYMSQQLSKISSHEIETEPTKLFQQFVTMMSLYPTYEEFLWKKELDQQALAMQMNKQNNTITALTNLINEFYDTLTTTTLDPDARKQITKQCDDLQEILESIKAPVEEKIIPIKTSYKAISLIMTNNHEMDEKIKELENQIRVGQALENEQEQASVQPTAETFQLQEIKQLLNDCTEDHDNPVTTVKEMVLNLEQLNEQNKQQAKWIEEFRMQQGDISTRFGETKAQLRAAIKESNELKKQLVTAREKINQLLAEKKGTATRTTSRRKKQKKEKRQPNSKVQVHEDLTLAPSSDEEPRATKQPIIIPAKRRSDDIIELDKKKQRIQPPVTKKPETTTLKVSIIINLTLSSFFQQNRLITHNFANFVVFLAFLDQNTCKASTYYCPEEKTTSSNTKGKNLNTTSLPTNENVKYHSTQDGTQLFIKNPREGKFVTSKKLPLPSKQQSTHSGTPMFITKPREAKSVVLLEPHYDYRKQVSCHRSDCFTTKNFMRHLDSVLTYAQQFVATKTWKSSYCLNFYNWVAHMNDFELRQFSLPLNHLSLKQPDNMESSSFQPPEIAARGSSVSK